MQERRGFRPVAALERRQRIPHEDEKRQGLWETRPGKDRALYIQGCSLVKIGQWTLTLKHEAVAERFPNQWATNEQILENYAKKGRPFD